MSRNIQDSLMLSEFVSQTLVQIIRGVEEARSEISEMGSTAEICPVDLKFERGHSSAPFKPGRGFVHDVEFNVAVIVDKGNTIKGSGDTTLSLGVPSVSWLPGGSVEGKLSVDRQQEESKVSHIKFKVPILFPGSVKEEIKG